MMQETAGRDNYFINKAGSEWCLDPEKTAFVILFFNFYLTCLQKEQEEMQLRERRGDLGAGCAGL